MDLQLAGKRVLVTGSSSGIGAGVAKALAGEGALVIVHGRDAARAGQVAEAILRAGGSAATACGDLCDDDQAAAVAAAATAAFGGVDVLVNNAGGASADPRTSWLALPVSEWARTYETNVLGAVRLIHALLPAMRERGWGRIINIATAAAITPTSGQPDYGPAKAAMLNMSLALSKAIAGSGVTVNAISPGMIRTDGLDRFLAEFARKRGMASPGEAEAFLIKANQQTVHRAGEIEDIAYAVAFLASPRSGFINGANLHADGGISPSLH